MVSGCYEGGGHIFVLYLHHNFVQLIVVQLLLRLLLLQNGVAISGKMIGKGTSSARIIGRDLVVVVAVDDAERWGGLVELGVGGALCLCGNFSYKAFKCFLFVA